MASPFRLRRTSRDESQSERDNRVRTANIKAGRGNSTAEHKGKFKAATPKGAAREEMSGKSDAPARKKSRPKGGGGGVKSTSPFRKTPSTNIPTPTPRPPVASPDMAVSPTRPDNFNQPAGAFRPPMQAPFNPQMSDASILHTVPPELKAPMPFAHAGTETAPWPSPQVPILDKQGFAGQETAPRPPLPGPMDMLGGGAPGRPPVGMGGPVGAGQPPVGMGGASGAGNPVIDQAAIARLLGFGR